MNGEQFRSVIFDMVANPGDWRGAICCVINDRPEIRAAVAGAVLDYTATPASFEALGNHKMIVRAVGYRNGPAGP